MCIGFFIIMTMKKSPGDICIIFPETTPHTHTHIELYTHVEECVSVPLCVRMTGKQEKKKLSYFLLTFSQLGAVSIFCHSFDGNSFTMCQQLNSVCSFMTVMKFPFTYHYSQSCGEKSRDALATPYSMTRHSRLKC